MARYLSQEWHQQVVELAAALPARPGVGARVGFKVTGGPQGDIEYFQVVEDGRVVQQSLGTLADADFSFAVTWADSVSVASGALDANAAFMQGRMKVAGSVGKMLGLLPVTVSDEYCKLQEQLSAQTEF